MNLLKKYPIFPLVFSLFPGLSLLGHNISQITIKQGLRPILGSLILSLIVFLITFLVWRNTTKAALLSLAIETILLLYGQFYLGTFLNHLGWWGHGILIGLSLIAVIGCIMALRGLQKDEWKFILLFNICTVFLIAFPLIQIGNHYLNLLRNQQNQTAVIAEVTQNDIKTTSQYPDVYYIILDMYPREDILKNDFGYENSAFLNELEDIGFTVSSCSMSNYAQTELSLASSLNMDYLDKLGADLLPGNTDRTELDQLISHSRVKAYFESIGYKTVSLSAYPPLQWKDATVFYSTQPEELPEYVEKPIFSPYEAMFVKSTAGILILDANILKGSKITRSAQYPFNDHIRQQFYILDKLPEIARIKGPKLVFVHILIPHPPFVFHSDGSIVENPPPFPSAGIEIDEDYWHGLFRDQVVYVNSRLTPILHSLINSSSQPPVIILQGDHGPNSSNRMAVLTAVYSKEFQPSKSISPVNIFRELLTNTFGQNLTDLPNISYYSEYSDPYNFQIIKDTNSECTQP